MSKPAVAKMLGLACIPASMLSFGHLNGQTSSSIASKALYSHGTCSTTVLAPFGIAFIIDSRLTDSDGDGRVISQREGCKVRLPRPTVIIAGVGLEDAVDGTRHWNSLDEASKALETLSPSPSEFELNRWSFSWKESLLQHYKGSLPPSNIGKIAEVLLITKVNGQPYYRRTTVAWDGTSFQAWIAGQEIDKTHPYLEYSGACRQFVVHSSDEGWSLEPAQYRSELERQEMNDVADQMLEGTTVADLSVGVFKLEEVLTQIDDRLEGESAVIAPPYSTAEWPEGKPGWDTHFNPSCASPDTSREGVKKDPPQAKSENANKQHWYRKLLSRP